MKNQTLTDIKTSEIDNKEDSNQINSFQALPELKTGESEKHYEPANVVEVSRDDIYIYIYI